MLVFRLIRTKHLLSYLPKRGTFLAYVLYVFLALRSMLAVKLSTWESFLTPSFPGLHTLSSESKKHAWPLVSAEEPLGKPGDLNLSTLSGFTQLLFDQYWPTDALCGGRKER